MKQSEYDKWERKMEALFARADARFKEYGLDDKKARAAEREAAGILDMLNKNAHKVV